MSFLILDTDKQTTQSLRIQLALMSDRPIEVGDEKTLVALQKSKVAMPEMIFFDQDGDPTLVATITEELRLGHVNSSVLILGTSSKPNFSRYFDSYVRKPIFPRRLRHAVIESFARGQQRRSIIGYVGKTVPADLLRELSRGTWLWKQITKIDLTEKDSLDEMSKLGLVFVDPEGLSTAELAWVRKVYKAPLNTRVTVVGVGKAPEKVCRVRSYVDYFVDAESGWNRVLDGVACFRLNQFRSEFEFDYSSALAKEKKVFRSSILLRRLVQRDPWNIKAKTLLAEIAFEKRKFQSAAALYKDILELNPSLPQPYFRLFDIEKIITGKVSKETLDAARNYCPKLKQLNSPELG